MTTILHRTIQDTPENELLIRALQDYISAQKTLLTISGEVIASINSLADVVEKLYPPFA